MTLSSVYTLLLFANVFLFSVFHTNLRHFEAGRSEKPAAGQRDSCVTSVANRSDLSRS